ncbi:MAG: SAM-dependent methyltransferase, partial [Candidatus Competibacterales bacterium]
MRHVACPPETLPAPDCDGLAHSERLVRLMVEEMAAAGGSSFRRYMELALCAPGLGYYRAGAAKFGAPGDFVTAPELSPLFARCLARQCAPVLQTTGGGVRGGGGGGGRR